jgi:copper chaperone CopZ
VTAMTETNLSIEIDGMSCEGCVASVKSVLARIPGLRVQTVAVGKAVVSLEGATEADVLRAIEKAGFRSSCP